jgi:acyl-CoA synthetase (AMP-forming)/AMP-acid ligase II
VPAELARRYHDEGRWTGGTLGATVAARIARDPHLPFHVRSQVRPYTGTLAEVDRAARSLDRALKVREWPESPHLVGDFLRTATGRIQRPRLCEQVRDGLLRKLR